MPSPIYNDYISQITLPNGTTYHVKDSEARQWIEDIAAGGLTFVIAWDGQSTPDASKIPYGVKVNYQQTEYTGTLAASTLTKANIYLVYAYTYETRNVFDEYVTVNLGTPELPNYAWECLGSTDIRLNLGDLAYHDNVVLDKGNGDNVLGADTTFTNGSSAVTFVGGTDDTFVKSYPGTSNKLETTTIKGVGADVTFTAVASATSATATNTVFGTDTTASKIVTETKTASNTVFGTATTASKATAGTAVTLATPAATATSVSYIGNAQTDSVLSGATVNGETLVLGTVAVSQGSVTGISGSETVTPYTFADVTVPVVTSNDSVSVASVKTNTDVTVPVVSSNTSVTATLVTTESKTAATAAASATTVATGSLNSEDAVGATVMTGLGTATTGSAVTSIGTGTAAAQTITVGSNDTVKVAAYDDLGVRVVDNE